LPIVAIAEHPLFVEAPAGHRSSVQHGACVKYADTDVNGGVEDAVESQDPNRP
jgi:hypothetical protein